MAMPVAGAKLFGTDGVRGVAGEELTSELALHIGQAVAATLHKDYPARKLRVAIGRDTRISGTMLESAVAAGLCALGADVILLGVVPTPAVALLTKRWGLDAGIVISASHNPMEFNGIKVFSGEGYKLPDGEEAAVEAFVRRPETLPPFATGADVGTISRRQDAVKVYANHVVASADVKNMSGLSIAFDCGNGAACETVRQIFPALGVDCHFLGVSPDGVNINKNGGSTNLSTLKKYVLEHKLSGGIAFDGDADRCLAVDENGQEIDGDKLIAIFARDMHKKGRLPQSTAVVTVMSNLGFLEYMRENGFRIATTAVGDRFVLEEMEDKGYKLGGEQSGHIILTDYNTTGDGQMTAAMLLSIVKESGQSLSQLNGLFSRFPQVLVNMTATAAQKAVFKEDEQLQGYIESEQQMLMGKGRILVRPSGTEPLIRIMVEGKDKEEIEATGERIRQRIEQSFTHAQR